MNASSSRLPVLFLFAFLASTVAAVAQPGGPGTGGDRVILDGVAAIVGREVILMSDVLQRTQLAAQQDRSVDPRSPEFQRQVLESLIDEKLVLTRAQEDSVVVREEEVTEAVERRLQQIISQAGGEAEVERIYGMPMERVRREARDVIRQQLVQQRLVQSRFRGLKVTDRDVREFYELFRDSLPTVPEQIELQQIVLRARPSAEAKAATVALARTITDSIRAGGDFADFARRYSVDAASAREGGDLGWVAPGVFVKEFERAVRRLATNEISEPVESAFGVHIIQLLGRRSDGSFHTRHILLPLQQSTTMRDSLVGVLNALRSRALGGESFEELARRYSEEEISAATGGTMGRIAVEQIPAELKPTVGTLQVGQITEPLPVQLSQTENGFRIIRLARRIPPHQLDLNEDRALIETRALGYKQNREWENWITELRKEIYWEIKTNF